MKKNILVCGSLAYDILYHFKGNFKESLARGVTLDAPLSIGFNVSHKEEFFGGCAGNIAYNGRLLNEDFRLLGVVGKDFGRYREWLQKNKISCNEIIENPKKYSSQAVLATDSNNQQIIFFHEGAAGESDYFSENLKHSIARDKENTLLMHIAPNPRDFVVLCTQEAQSLNIPYLFDPGQALPVFEAELLKKIIKGAFGLIVNEYELGALLHTLLLTQEELLAEAGLLIVTRGEAGSTIYWGESQIAIPAEKVGAVVDPTGCGDAYRAGFLSVLRAAQLELSPETLQKAGLLGTRLASACLSQHGTQNHSIKQ